jgi:putative transposase
MSESTPTKRVYDYRLRNYVRQTRDDSIAISLGVPRSTISSWLNSPVQEVVTHEVFDLDDLQVRRRILNLEHRLRIVTAIMVLLLVLIRTFRIRLDFERLPDGKSKQKLLRAIERADKVLPLRSVLRILKLSSSRYHAWKRAEENGCKLDDLLTCPKINSNQLTPNEVKTMREMGTSPEYRHVSTGKLAILAQRLGKLFASPSTWGRYVKTRGWRRPRVRIHPSKPVLGLRCEAPDETWHIDTTVIRLLDGTKAYLQAIIDNYSRRILAWRLGESLEPGSTSTLLAKAYEGRSSAGQGSDPQSVMVDAGVENLNDSVKKLVDEGLMKLILAQTDISYSNSMIEAYWRVLKNQWLYLNHLDSIVTLRRLVEFYVDQYNTVLPHSAFRGQTPDEMYFGTGKGIPDQLAAAGESARQERIEVNRNLSCETCHEQGQLGMVVNE